MAGRRVIATAEVQVASDVKQAEAGLNGLTETFRQIGATAERAAEKAEAAFRSSSGNIQGAYQNILRDSNKLLNSMEQVDDTAKHMAGTFREALSAIKALSTEDGYEEKAVQALRIYKEIAGALGVVESGLHDSATAAQLIANNAREAAQRTQEIENATLEAERRAHKLAEAFRDVGQDIDVAMAGGMEGLQDDINQTIRRLAEMGDQGHDVSRILERAFDNVLGEFENDTHQATAALLKLQSAGNNALDTLDNDARKASGALNDMTSSASRADRAVDRIGGVSRRVSGDVSGLASVIGAAGLGYAAMSAAKAGIEMTQQLEKSEAMFLGLTGSAEGAADMLERMVMFARETPYNLANVSDAAAQLLAVGDGFGVTTSTIEDFLTTFGNAITMTGGGDEQFTRLVRVFGQMSSSGKVLGQDMNQLAQSLPGYNVWQALADGAGTSVAELRRLQDLGTLDNLLTGDQAVRILVEGMEKIPGAAGAMERRMHTLGGALEKFRETAQFAITEGMVPFSETAQDVLGDPVILNSVEDLSFAFGDLLSQALQDVQPELDDLAAGAEDLIAAFEDWTPVLGSIVDMLADFLGFVAPIVSTVGKATEALLGFGDGLAKIAIGVGLLFTGPLGIAAGAVMAVSGAMDLMGQSSENAADMIRLLKSGQEELNTVMAAGEEATLSEAQQTALDTANMLAETYPRLTAVMEGYNVGILDLQTGLFNLANGTGEVTPELQAMAAAINDPAMAGGDLAREWDSLIDKAKEGSDGISTAAREQSSALAQEAIEEIGILEDRAARQQAYNEEVKAYWEEYGQNYQNALDAAQVANDGWGELDADRTDTLRGVLEDQVKAYDEWESGINESTSGAALSLSSVAEEAENSAARMIQAINENSVATFAWKGNIVTAASQIQGALGLTDTEAQDFMGTLGEMGPAAAPALQQMVDDFANGGTLLTDFFNATKLNADVMATDLTDSFDEATGSVPSLAESLSEGTATIDQVLAALPAAMSAAGIDMETAASMIDMSDEMGAVGTQAVNGLVNAVGSPAAISRARAAGALLANAVEAGASDSLDIHSPSKVMIDIGEFAVEGLVVGMDSMSDEAYDKAVQVASLMGGGIAWYFRKAEEPYDEARKFAENVAQTIVDELIAEQEAVADAAEALAEAAADRLSEAWDRVKDRFKTRDIQEAIADAQADLQDARAELASAEAFASTGGQEALAAAQQRIARAQQQIAQAQQAQHAAEAADAAAELLAEKTIKDFQRATEDAVAALKEQQTGEVDAINTRIADAKRRLDPVARAAAEADLVATKARHEAEMQSLDRQREDEESVLKLRLDNEDDIRDAAIKAQEDQVKIFEKALDDANKELEDVGEKIADAIKSLPGLRTEVGDSQRDLEGAFFDQFEKLLQSVSSVDRGLLESIGANAGLTATEVNDLINSAIASESASQGAAAANLGVGQLLEVLSSGLFSLGANGALGIAEGLSSQAHAIAEALFATVENAVGTTLQRLDIHSPSGVTEDLIGKPMADGIAVGITKATSAVQSAMTGLVDSVVGGVKLPSSSSQLVGASSGGGDAMMGAYRGPLVTMPGAIIQDATDADLVAQRVVVALAATGVQV